MADAIDDFLGPPPDTKVSEAADDFLGADPQFLKPGAPESTLGKVAGAVTATVLPPVGAAVSLAKRFAPAVMQKVDEWAPGFVRGTELPREALSPLIGPTDEQKERESVPVEYDEKGRPTKWAYKPLGSEVDKAGVGAILNAPLKTTAPQVRALGQDVVNLAVPNSSDQDFENILKLHSQDPEDYGKDLPVDKTIEGMTGFSKYFSKFGNQMLPDVAYRTLLARGLGGGATTGLAHNIATGVAFGLQDDGRIDLKQAAVMAVLPKIGDMGAKVVSDIINGPIKGAVEVGYSADAAGKIATDKFGKPLLKVIKAFDGEPLIKNELAAKALEEIVGRGGAQTAALTASQMPQIMGLPPEQRRQAIAETVAYGMAFSLMSIPGIIDPSVPSGARKAVVGRVFDDITKQFERTPRIGGEHEPEAPPATGPQPAPAGRSLRIGEPNATNPVEQQESVQPQRGGTDEVGQTSAETSGGDSVPGAAGEPAEAQPAEAKPLVGDQGAKLAPQVIPPPNAGWHPAVIKRADGTIYQAIQPDDPEMSDWAGRLVNGKWSHGILEKGETFVPSPTKHSIPPTPAQAKSGEYPKEKVQVDGLTIAIENTKGSVRSGKDKGGKPWSVTMPAHYGEIEGSKGADGDKVDAYLGDVPNDVVYVIDQQNPATGKHDESKAMINFADQKTAVETYHKAFSDGSGPSRIKAVVAMPKEEFKKWALSKRAQEAAVEHPDAVEPAKPHKHAVLVADAPGGQKVFTGDSGAEALEMAEEYLGRKVTKYERGITDGKGVFTRVVAPKAETVAKPAPVVAEKPASVAQVKRREYYTHEIKRTGVVYLENENDDNLGSVRIVESNSNPGKFVVWHTPDGGERIRVSDPVSLEEAQKIAVDFSMKQSEPRGPRPTYEEMTKDKSRVITEQEANEAKIADQLARDGWRFNQREKVWRYMQTEVKPASVAPMTFEEFEKQYREAFSNLQRYTPDQGGHEYFVQKMAILHDSHPEWAAKVEAKKESGPKLNVIGYNKNTRVVTTPNGDMFAFIREIKKRGGQKAYEVKGYNGGGIHAIEGKHPDLEQTYEARGEAEAIEAAREIARRELAKRAPVKENAENTTLVKPDDLNQTVQKPEKINPPGKQPHQMTVKEWQQHEARGTWSDYADEPLAKARAEEKETSQTLQKYESARKKLGDIERIGKVMTNRDAALARNKARKEASKAVDEAKASYKRASSKASRMATHEAFIKRAMERGETIPPEVLAEHPDLVPKPKPVEFQANNLLTALKSAGAIGGPDLDDAMKEMDSGKTAAKVMAEYGGHYDAMTDPLESIYEEWKKRKNSSQMGLYRKAWDMARFGGGGRKVTDTLEGLKSARDEGFGFEGGVPSDTSDLIHRAWTDALNKAGNKMEFPKDAEGKAQLFWEVAMNPDSKTGLKKIDPKDLTIGSTFRVRGKGLSHEEFTVTNIDADGMVTVKDGQIFGLQSLPEGSEIWVQDLKIKPQEENTEFLPPEEAVKPKDQLFDEKEMPFNLAGEKQAPAEKATPVEFGGHGDEQLAQQEMFTIQKVVADKDPVKSADAAQAMYGGAKAAADKIEQQLRVVDADMKTKKDFLPEQRARLKEVVALLRQRALEVKSGGQSLIEFAKSKLSPEQAAKITDEKQVESFRAQWEKEQGKPAAQPGKPSNQFPKELAKRLLSLSREAQTSAYGPQNESLRQDVLEAITGVRPAKSKSGAKAVELALQKYFGIDPAKMAGIHVEEAVREKLQEAAGEGRYSLTAEERNGLPGGNYWQDTNGKLKWVGTHEEGASEILNLPFDQSDPDASLLSENTNKLLEKGWARVISDRHGIIVEADDLTNAQKRELINQGIEGRKKVEWDKPGGKMTMIYDPAFEGQSSLTPVVESNRVGGHVTRDHVHQRATELVSDWPGAPKINVVDRPDWEKKSKDGTIQVVSGSVKDDTMTLNVAGLRDMDHLAKIVNHELVHHVWPAIQNDPAYQEDLKAIEASITPEQRAKIADQYNVKAGDPAVFEEWVANRAGPNEQGEPDAEAQSLWSRIWEAIKKAFRRLFGKQTTEDRLESVREAIRENLAKGNRAEPLEERFSLTKPEDKEPSVPTEVMGNTFNVEGRDRITPESAEASIAHAGQVLTAGNIPAALETEVDPRQRNREIKWWKFDNDGFERNAEGRKLIETLTKEIGQANSPGKNPDHLASLLNSIRINYARDNMGMFDPSIRDRLFALAQADISYHAAALGATAGHSVDLGDIAKNVRVTLDRVYSDAFGGDAYQTLFKRISGTFRSYFTDDEIAKAVKDTPALADFFQRMLAVNQEELGGAVYRRVHAQLKPKRPKTPGQKEREAKVDEAVNQIIENAKKAGVTEPAPIKNQKLTPMETLGLMTRPETQVKIQDAIENAIRQAELNAGRMAWRKGLATNKDALAEAEAEMEAGAEPSEEYIEQGLELPEYAHWKAIRDNLLNYSPTTLKLVQKVISGQFKGTKFKPTVKQVADLRINLRELAKKPETEVARVLDAQLDAVTKVLGMNKANDATRLRVRQMMLAELQDQLTKQQKSIRDNFFDPKKAVPTTASTRLHSLLNAKLAEDPRFKTSKVAALIKKMAGKYVDADEVADLATEPRTAKTDWIRKKMVEIEKAENFNAEPPATADFLRAVTFTHLAERLQAAEEAVTRSFLNGKDVELERQPITPEARAARLEAARAKLEGIINAGGLDTPMIERAAAKSAIQRLMPSINSIAKEILATPFYRQSEMKSAFVDKVMGEIGVDKAMADKLWETFATAFKSRFDIARQRALKQARESLSPREQEVIKGRPIWQKIERAVNAGVFDDADIVRQIAAAHGWKPPTDDQVKAMRDLSEREQRLRELTQAEKDKINNDPDLTPKEKEKALATGQREKEAATQLVRAGIIREMATRWSSMTKPINIPGFNRESWSVWHGTRNNLSDALNEFSTLNALVKVGFVGFRLPVHLTTQLLWHIPYSSVARALTLREQDIAKGDTTKFLADTITALSDSMKASIKAIKPALLAARAELTGRGESRNVDRLMSGINASERVAAQADALAKEGKNIQALVMHLTNFPRYMQWYISAVDHMQGIPAEYQEIMHQITMSMRNQGKTAAEINTFKDVIFNLMKTEHVVAVADVRQMFEASGIEATKSQIEEAAANLVKRRIYDKLAHMGLPADAFQAANAALRATMSWQDKTVRGVGAMVAKPLEMARAGARWAGLPMPFAQFSNAIATGINYAFMSTPLYKLANIPFSKDAEPSGWFRTDMDRKRRAAQALLSSMMGAVIFALVAAGVATVHMFAPKDKTDREKFIAEGHKAGTVEFNTGHGTFIPISLTVGPMALFAPYFAGAGAVRDLTDSRAKAQNKMNKEAEKKGVEPGKVASISVADWAAVAAKAGLAALLANKTAGGLVASLTENNQFSAKKSISAGISTFIPGLPGYQELTRAAGIAMDPKTATVMDFMVPLPTSSHLQVNFMGDPVKTPDDLQRIVQTMTAGSYPGIVDPAEAKNSAAYRLITETGFRPPSINANKGYSINGEFRPMTSQELQTYTVARGQELKSALSNLPENADLATVKQAYSEANNRALESVGAEVVKSASSGGSGGNSLTGGPLGSGPAGMGEPKAERQSGTAPERQTRTSGGFAGRSLMAGSGRSLGRARLNSGLQSRGGGRSLRGGGKTSIRRGTRVSTGVPRMHLGRSLRIR